MDQTYTVDFDFNAFEEHIPHDMRFKHAQVMPDGTLYWVTYGFFDARDLRDFRDALDKFTSMLYVISKIPVQRLAAKILEIITSFAIIFKNSAVTIGNAGVVIILISLYGINPSEIALAVL